MKTNIGVQQTKVCTIKCIKHSTESNKPQLLGPLWQHDYERSPTIALFITSGDSEGAACFTATFRVCAHGKVWHKKVSSVKHSEDYSALVKICSPCVSV